MAAVTMLIAGCSGGESTSGTVGTASASQAPPNTSSAPTTTAGSAGAPVDALKARVQAYSDAYLTGNADQAYDILTERCRDRMPAEQFATIVAGAEQAYGSALEFGSFDAQVSGDLARVTYTYPIKAINQDREPWAVEGGKWHLDDC